MANNSLNLEISVEAKLRGVLALVGRLNQLQERVKVSRKFEQLNATLLTVEGSRSKREESMSWIKDFTKTTPFQLEEVSKAFIKMRAFGIEPTEGALMSLRDTSSAMGKSIDQGVEALRDALTGEFERLKEFGIKTKNLGDNIRFNFRTSSGEAKEVIIKNNSEVIESTLLSIWNEKYRGRADLQSKTLNGLVSNIQDNITNLQDSFIQQSGIFDLVKSSLRDLGSSIEGFNLNSKEMLELSKFIINSFGLFRSSINSLSLTFDTLGNLFETNFTDIGLRVDLVKGNFNLFIETVKQLGPEVQNAVVKTISKLSELEVALLKLRGKDEQAFLLEQKIKVSLAQRERRVTDQVVKRAKINEDIAKTSERIEENRLNFYKKQNKLISDYNQKQREINENENLLINKSVVRNKLQTSFNNLVLEQKTLISEVSKLGEDLTNGKIKQLAYDNQINLLNTELLNNFNNQKDLQSVILNQKLLNGDITKEQFEKEKNISSEKTNQLQTESKINEEKKKQANVKEFKEFQKLLKSRQEFSTQINKEIESIKNKNLTELDLLKKNFDNQLKLNLEFNTKINEARKDSNIAKNIDLNKREELNNKNRLAIEKKYQLEKTNLEIEEERKRKIKAREALRNLDDGGIQQKLGITTEVEEDNTLNFDKQEQQLQQLQDFQAKRLLLMYNNHRTEKELQAQHDKDMLDLEDAKNKLMYKNVNDGLSSGLNLVKSFNRLGLIEDKKRAQRQQRIAIVQTTINTFKSRSERYTQGGPYLGPILRAVATAQGLAQVRQIKAQRFHTGGYIDPSMGGSNGMRNDEVSTILQTGEGVVSRRGMKELENLNDGKGSEISNNSSSNEVNVVIVDNRQSREDYIQSRKGKNIIKEING